MTPEFSRRQLLATPSAGAPEEILEASAAECAALAARFGIPALHGLSARFTRRPYPGGGVLITGRLSARPEQLCVVSLEPVVEAVDAPFSLLVMPAEAALPEDLDGPDEIQADASGHYDLGEAIAEELSLCLNPYPRAPEAKLPEALGEAEAEPARNPFAKLAALKPKPGKG